MYVFSDASKSKLETCHIDLVAVATNVLKVVDHRIICGWRNKAAQDKAIADRTSKVAWPNSKHNFMRDDVPCSLALDALPMDCIKNGVIDWNNTKAFAFLAGVYRGVAEQMGISLRWGHDWNDNGSMRDEAGKLVDMPHFELYGEKYR